MVNGIESSLSPIRPGSSVSPGAGAGSAAGVGGASFSDVLKKSIEEVSKLQQDASSAVENLMTGKSDDMIGVMTAVEKSDLAFKTLLAIRTKLMDAYEQIKNMPI